MSKRRPSRPDGAPPARSGPGRAPLIALLAVGAVAAVVWFVTRTAPGAADIGSAVGQLPGDAPAAATGEPAALDPVDGAWTVDTSIGSFSVEDTTGTFVGFRVDEELANVGATTAIGRTPAVDGEIELDGSTLTAASFEADLTQIVSNESRRDDAIQRALETDRYPTATFELTEPVELSEVPAEGAAVEATAVGDLTLHGVTTQVEVPLQVALRNGVGVVTGSFPVAFDDYDVEAPTAPIVLSVEDDGVVELQLFLSPA